MSGWESRGGVVVNMAPEERKPRNDSEVSMRPMPRRQRLSVGNRPSHTRHSRRLHYRTRRRATLFAAQLPQSQQKLRITSAETGHH